MIEPGSLVYADESSVYNRLHGQFAQVRRVNHDKQFANGPASTNWAESYFARLDRAEMGIHHRIAGRKKTQGEAILVASKAFKAVFPSRAYGHELSALRQATLGTSLHRRVTDIERILNRYRWSGPTTREYEVYRELGVIEFYADHYHREPA